MLQKLQLALRSGQATPQSVAAEALARANSNAGQNVYLAQDGDRFRREAESLEAKYPGTQRPLLYGLPISLKDCFDLEGFVTTAGTRYYAEHNSIAVEDSAVAAQLRSQGALIVGKTHLHPLAYGITGENPDFGDCVQPRDPQRLTGGSSSGAAASVQEGSAVAAIGTDTGGSIRVPAALCGLAGYRASIGLAHELGLWRGGIHLSQSFDTLGWLFGDLREGPILAEALFGLAPEKFDSPDSPVIGSISKSFLRGCDLSVLDVFAQWQERLLRAGAQFRSFDGNFWEEAFDIFAPIQAKEAAAIHGARTGGDFSQFEPSVADRLKWGDSLSVAEVQMHRHRHAAFRDQMDSLFGEFDFLIAPCAPVDRLVRGADNSKARARILRYTVPMSLAGTPVVTLPDDSGVGVQLIAPRGQDAKLLAFAAELASCF
jgi:Asp-tRNA(Asn)/Glu-tRNA(Gln) amidotransferase A subunit family amidase